MAREWVRPEHIDYLIKEEGVVVGKLRIKANAILWKPHSAKLWYKMALEDFADYAVTLNDRVKH
jgi:hypothetical protein